MWRLYSYMYVARADNTEYVYASRVFRPESFFFLYKKYIEFNTVANLIRLHSYGRIVSRMTDKLVNVSRMTE